MARKNRLVWIANVRGMLMIFVVCFHATQQYGSDWILIFFRLMILPLFFFMSGMLLQNNISASDFFKQKVRHLVLPYFQFCGLVYAIYLLRKLHNPAFITNSKLVQQLIGIFYASHSPALPIINLPLWFLPCLFIVQCIIFGFMRFSKITFCILLVLTAVAGIQLQQIPFPLPWSFAHACTYAIFAGLGYLSAKKLCRSSAILPLKMVIPAWLFWIFGASAIYSTGFVEGLVPLLGSLSNISPLLGLLGYLSSISSILATIGLFQRLPKTTYLSVIGKNTIEILSLHYVAFMLTTIILRKCFHIPVESVAENLALRFPAWEACLLIFTYIILGIVLPLLYVNCCNFFVTRKTLIKNRLKESRIFKITYGLKRPASF